MRTFLRFFAKGEIGVARAQQAFAEMADCGNAFRLVLGKLRQGCERVGFELNHIFIFEKTFSRKGKKR